MKNLKRILLAMLVGCLLVGTAFFASCSKKKPDPEPGPDVTDPEPEPEPEPEPTLYTVTYSFGTCEGIPYAGTSTLPAEGDKEEGATFTMASALVWEGYIFKGWNDGTEVVQAGATYTMPAHNVTFTATWELKPEPEPTLYTVTYSFGTCEGTPYAGTSTLPTEASKEEGATFTLADALVWEGYTFKGWNDGTEVVQAGATYTMPAHNVTFTAMWKAVPVATLQESIQVNSRSEAHTDFVIGKGQRVVLTASFSGKKTTDVGYGPVAQVYADGETGESYYFFRNDCAVEVINGSWDNWWTWDQIQWQRDEWDALGEGGMDAIVKALTSGSVKITVELDEIGTLIETYTMYKPDGERLHTSTYTVVDRQMETARVFFAADECTVSSAVVTYPNTVKVTLDWGEQQPAEDWIEGIETHLLSAGETFTFGTDIFKMGYEFLGWQLNGEGRYYKQGDTFVLEDEDVTFIAAWRLGISVVVDENGVDGRGWSVTLPKRSYNEDTGKYEISGYPEPSLRFTKTGYALKGWEMTVDGEVVVPESFPYSVDPGVKVVFKAIWSTPYTVTYKMGSCEDVAYAGKTKTPTETVKAETNVFTLASAPVWEGYTFKGWSDGKETYEAGAKYTMPAENVTFTALWEKNEPATVQLPVPVALLPDSKRA